MAVGSLFLIAGPNGAGKTTLVTRLGLKDAVAGYHKINADDRTLELLRKRGMEFLNANEDELRSLFIQAANESFSEALALLEAGANVQTETVLSTAKYREMVERVKSGGGHFTMIYVALCSPLLSLQRVKSRAAKGGHDVPADRLTERWQRSLVQLEWFALRADSLLVYDNSASDAEKPPLLIAQAKHGDLQWKVEDELVFPELKHALTQAFSVQKHPDA